MHNWLCCCVAAQYSPSLPESGAGLNTKLPSHKCLQMLINRWENMIMCTCKRCWKMHCSRVFISHPIWLFCHKHTPLFSKHTAQSINMTFMWPFLLYFKRRAQKGDGKTTIEMETFRCIRCHRNEIFYKLFLNVPVVLEHKSKKVFLVYIETGRNGLESFEFYNRNPSWKGKDAWGNICKLLDINIIFSQTFQNIKTIWWDQMILGWC